MNNLNVTLMLNNDDLFSFVKGHHKFDFTKLCLLVVCKIIFVSLVPVLIFLNSDFAL